MSSNNVLFEITTSMDKEDYRKFSYLSIFKKKYLTISLIIILAGVGAAFAVFAYGDMDPIKFLVTWIGLVIIAFGAICLRVEYKNLKMMSMARAGLANLKQVIRFYENYLIAESENVKGSNKIKYDKLYQILESNDYYIIYANANSASLIRKKDIKEEEQDGFYRLLKIKLGNRYKKIAK